MCHNFHTVISDLGLYNFTQDHVKGDVWFVDYVAVGQGSSQNMGCWQVYNVSLHDLVYELSFPFLSAWGSSDLILSPFWGKILRARML